jgi:hypothetical protein
MTLYDIQIVYNAHHHRACPARSYLVSTIIYTSTLVEVIHHPTIKARKCLKAGLHEISAAQKHSLQQGLENKETRDGVNFNLVEKRGLQFVTALMALPKHAAICSGTLKCTGSADRIG